MKKTLRNVGIERPIWAEEGSPVDCGSEREQTIFEMLEWLRHRLGKERNQGE